MYDYSCLWEPCIEGNKKNLREKGISVGGVPRRTVITSSVYRCQGERRRDPKYSNVSPRVSCDSREVLLSLCGPEVPLWVRS